ncbi:MAG: protein kinase [Phycisphaerae bacterium]|nr:protein kinase [Gemmatimonadaceae bacterium]
MIDEIHVAPGTEIGGRYVVERALGSGSFGRTYLVRDSVRNALVALKFFDPKSARDLKAQELFQREGSVLRSLRHHGVPEVYETGSIELAGRTLPVLAMEFIEGPSLAAMIQQQHRFAPGEAHRLFFDMLSVLEYLHECAPPVLHRDIKPANVILRERFSGAG